MTDKPIVRCPGPSTRDIVLSDALPPPAEFIAESYAWLGDDDLSYEAYTSEGVARLEREQLALFSGNGEGHGDRAGGFQGHTFHVQRIKAGGGHRGLRFVQYGLK